VLRVLQEGVTHACLEATLAREEGGSYGPASPLRNVTPAMHRPPSRATRRTTASSGIADQDRAVAASQAVTILKAITCAASQGTRTEILPVAVPVRSSGNTR